MLGSLNSLTICSRFIEQFLHGIVGLRQLELQRKEVVPIAHKLNDALTDFRHFLVLNAADINVHCQGGANAIIAERIVQMNAREESFLGHLGHAGAMEHHLEPVYIHAFLTVFSI